MLGTTVSPVFEPILLPQLRRLNCSRRGEVRISLTEFMFINIMSDCISIGTGKIMIKDDQQFCSVVSTKGKQGGGGGAKRIRNTI